MLDDLPQGFFRRGVLVGFFFVAVITSTVIALRCSRREPKQAHVDTAHGRFVIPGKAALPVRRGMPISAVVATTEDGCEFMSEVPSPVVVDVTDARTADGRTLLKVQRIGGCEDQWVDARFLRPAL